MDHRKILIPFITIAFVTTILVSCDTTGTNPSQGNGNVALQFKTVSGTQSKALGQNSIASEHDSVVVDGSNGSLQIDDIRFIVEKFKFEYEDDGCAEADSLDDESSECEEFEAEPFFVDLPLNEDILSLANDEIGTGLYKKIEFEVKDLDFENEEEGDDQEHQALADSIRADFPEWPDEASMIITGTFTPTDGDPRPFKVFAKAEIEIEHEFEPPLEVTEDNMQQVVSININPARWLQQEDGSVTDLSQYDWNEYGELLEFSAKFKDGIEDIEVDEEEFDDDSDE